MDIDKYKTLFNTLEKGHHVRIVSHRNPDGDAIGSMIAFSLLCDFFKLDYNLVLIDPIPDNLLFMTEGFNFQSFHDIRTDDILNEQTDIVAFMDCGQFDRAGNLCDYIQPHQKIINIDHHMSNPMFGDVNHVEDISSTCELLFNILDFLSIAPTPAIAQAIYIGILTDTGMFQFDKTSPNTHIIIAKLMDYKIDHFYIYQNIYQNYPISWISLLTQGLNDLELFDNDSIAIICFPNNNSLFLEQIDNTNVFFPILLSIKSIKICILIKEKDEGIISASLRSKDDIDVAQIAQVFGGGGHQKAAGCRSSQYSILEFKNILYNEIKKTYY